MYGRLEIFSNGGWGTVCAGEAPQTRGRLRFNSAAVNLACKQIGFERGVKTVLPVRVPMYPLDVHMLFTLVASAVCVSFSLLFVEFRRRCETFTMDNLCAYAHDNTLWHLCRLQVVVAQNHRFTQVQLNYLGNQ